MVKIWTMGELIVEIMRAAPGIPLDKTDTFLGPYPSGAPAIFVQAAAQLGADAKIWGGVGRDKFGNVILSKLKSEGVDISDVKVGGSAGATGTAFVSYDSDGGREFIFHIDGTASGIVDFTPPSSAPDFFHVMGCSLTVNEKMKSAIESACANFAARGAKISFDPNIRPSLLGERGVMETAGAVMKLCKVFLPGVDELALFAESGGGIDAQAKILFERFANLEIIHVKNGKRGSVIITREGKTEVPPYPIEKKYPIVDPTGAGDCFDAAFVTALANGETLACAGALAAKSGAINATAMGPMSGNIKKLMAEC
ncbi:MAG: sugar kinase [Spirochaetaceae bacterium]|nr:sugar kinase [Spirochaetaceae bacterium]